MKSRYLNLMEKVLSAYTDDHILKYVSEVKEKGITEHGFPRLTANIGILISHGRKVELIDLFIRMMDICCEEFLKPKKRLMGNDFSVKEIIFCLMEIEKSGKFSEEKVNYWRRSLSKISAENCYNVYATSKEESPANWALFTAVSEFMREYVGLADSKEFVDIQIATQLKRLDENGMYRDGFGEAHEPMVYDLVPRGLFSILLHFGYDGEYSREIDECLKKAGLLTLDMQSVTGEIPYGGRSNQFLHNEAQLAVIMEFEASRYYKIGDTELAGKFKAGVDRALANIEKWLVKEEISHVKNRYPIQSGFGCENYAYFDKYMITAASFLYAAYLLCDDSIEPVERDEKPVAFSLSRYFHKTFLKNETIFVEIDDNADEHYDASGIGRVHFKNAPSAICLSVPGTATPNYKADVDEGVDFSIAPGVLNGDEILFAHRDNAEYHLKELRFGATAEYDCKFKCGKTANLICEINKDNVTIKASSDDEVFLMLPAFEFDGKSHSDIKILKNILEVYYDGYICRYTSDNEIFNYNKTGFNRNGKYNLFYTKGIKEVGVKIEIRRDVKCIR